MRTKTLYNSEGKRTGFEIDFMLTMRKVKKVLSNMEGITDVQTRRLFSDFSDWVHMRFRYKGIPFVVMEPFGDSDCLCIVTEEFGDNGDAIAALEGAFAAFPKKSGKPVSAG
mgnify:CR=1 FL=1